MNLNAFLIPIVLGAFGLGAVSTIERTVSSDPQPGVDPYLGEIMWVPYNFEPRGWAFCNGQLLKISEYSALFSLLGTTFGGDGRETFGLPDLRGRMTIHAGEGPGLQAHRLGQRGGVENVTLTRAQMPTHAHTVQTSSEQGAADEPELTILDTIGAFSSASPTGAVQVISSEGGNQAHTNMPPYLNLHAVIALNGVYPSRN